MNGKEAMKSAAGYIVETPWGMMVLLPADPPHHERFRKGVLFTAANDVTVFKTYRSALAAIRRSKRYWAKFGMDDRWWHAHRLVKP